MLKGKGREGSEKWKYSNFVIAESREVIGKVSRNIRKCYSYKGNHWKNQKLTTNFQVSRRYMHKIKQSKYKSYSKLFFKGNHLKNKFLTIQSRNKFRDHQEESYSKCGPQT